MPYLLSSLVITFSLAAHAQDFTATVKSLAEGAPATQLAVPGAAPGWFFLRKELEHLAQGDLAIADRAKANKEGTDPLPVIAKYAAELKALGIDLLLVPVPPKAAIYPEKLDAKIDAATVPSLLPFYAKLTAAGVNVLDLETLLKDSKAKQPDKQLYCATDSHWSPYTCQLVANAVADKYKSLKEIQQYALADLKALPEETFEFHGDLLTDAEKAAVAKEKLPIVKAGLAVPPDGKAVTTVESDPLSAMLVMGDSHLQVFRKGGSMLATQGGFIDHLQTMLPAAVHEVSMQAGGADGPRVEIARATAKDPEFWAKKKVVVWVFTAREFTQGKWRMLPAKVVKK
jgi:alginate O-acetyltransferase complex protein AlgJ